MAYLVFWLLNFHLKFQMSLLCLGSLNYANELLLRDYYLQWYLIMTVNQQKSFGRCSGLMVSALDSKSSSSCSNSGWGHCVVFLGKISLQSILGDPGAVSGGRKKSKQARKKFGRRKVKKENKSSYSIQLLYRVGMTAKHSSFWKTIHSFSCLCFRSTRWKDGWNVFEKLPG